AEQLVFEAHVESGAVVLNVARDFTSLPPRPDFDPWMRAIAPELEGVTDEIGQYQAQQGRVPGDRGQGMDGDFHGDAVGGAPQLVHDRLRLRREVDGRRDQGLPADA